MSNGEQADSIRGFEITNPWLVRHPDYGVGVINISNQGAKLSRIEHQLTPGDVIGLQLGATKARYAWFG